VGSSQFSLFRSSYFAPQKLTTKDGESFEDVEIFF
jgi:hypothetical protein